MAFDIAGGRLMAARRSCLARALVVAADRRGGGVLGHRSKKPPTGTPEPDKFLFERGNEQLTAQALADGARVFPAAGRQLSAEPVPRRREARASATPTSARHSAESFVLAANEFREFLTFYPTHKRADYAQFKLGMTSFYQMHGPERDQTETHDAIKELADLRRNYPRSELLAEGQARLRDARDRLSQSEYRVGYFYWRSRWYPGAIDRFKAILANDPEFIEPRRALLPPRRLAGQDPASGGGAALLRAADQGVRDQPVSGGGDETG